MSDGPPVVATRERTASGAAILLGALRERGIQALYGIPGHGAYPLYDALNDSQVRPIVGRNEQGITFAAVAHSWATGGVAAATSVPEAGLTNAATALLEATMSQDRVLFIVEEDPLHEPIAQAVARYYRCVRDAESVGPAVHELIDELETKRPGAAILEIAHGALIGQSPPTSAGRPANQRSPRVDRQAFDRALEKLNGAQRVVICAGATALAADRGGLIQRIAERLEAPVFTDGFCKGLIAESHPLALGHSWTSTGPGELLMRDSDVVLTIGAPVAAGQNSVTWTPEMVVGTRSDDVLAEQLVVVDWDDQPTGTLPAAARVYGHVPSILEALELKLTGSRTPADPDILADTRRIPADYARRRIPVALDSLEAFAEAIPSDGILLLDSLVGLWLERLVCAERPRAVRFPFGTGTLGFGIPAAVGASVAHPDRVVIAAMGDGASLYNLQELATARLYGLRPICIVFNDNAYGAIKHNMTSHFGRSTAHDLKNPDFETLGRAFGLTAIRLDDPTEVGAALRQVLRQSRPALIEVPLELAPPSELFEFVVSSNPQA